MNFTRRHLFKTLGSAACILGLSSIVKGKSAESTETKSSLLGEVGIEWLGHGSFLFTSCNGRRILFDPWIRTNPKCPGRYKKPKMFEKVDFILWTHGHVDHFMFDDAKELIEQYNPKVIAPWELSFFIKTEIPKADTETFTLGNKGATAEIDGLKISMVEAFHSAGAQLTGFEGTNRFVGEAVGYVLEFENGLKIYHSGDTSLMSDMQTIIGGYYKPEIAILPIGGVFTMGSKEAAYACSMIKPKIVIPEHFGTFPVLEQTTELFSKELKAKASDVRMLEVVPGSPVKV